MTGFCLWGGRRASVLCAALLLTSPYAVAQSDTERAGARAAATEGGKAFDEGRYADAIDLFTRAESLVHAPPHLLYMARSHEKLGQLVKAREAYLKITREKLADNAPDAFKNAQTDAQKELAALEPRVPYLTIKLSGDGADAATVMMDDKPVPKPLIGVPYPVDPGEHKLQATGQGVQSDPVSVSIKESGRENVELALKPAPGAGSGDEGSGDTGFSADSSKIDTGGANGMKIGGYVALGVGVVGVAAGTYFVLQASSKRSEADDLCTEPGGACPVANQPEVDKLDDEANTASTLGIVSFVVGGVGIATGVTLLVLSSNKSSASNKPSIQPWVGLGSAGVSGRF